MSGYIRIDFESTVDYVGTRSTAIAMQVENPYRVPWDKVALCDNFVDVNVPIKIQSQ